MELKEFVSNTLSQIIEGIVISQENAKKSGAEINPYGVKIANFPSIAFTSTGQAGQIVEFDVALTAIESDEMKGSIGVVAAVLGVGVQGKAASSDSTINRVKFSVPVFLPFQKE